jgi:hypothetical protein
MGVSWRATRNETRGRFVGRIGFTMATLPLGSAVFGVAPGWSAEPHGRPASW